MSRLSIFSSKAELYCAHAILVGLAGFFSLWLVKFILSPSPLINYLGYAILTLGVILPLLVLKLEAPWKIKISTSFLGFILALYSLEYCFELMDKHDEKKSQQDKKNTTEVFDKISAEGKKHSVPVGTLSLLSAVNGNVYGSVKTPQGEILPLSNLALTPTLLCENNSGPVIFGSDRFGFNNANEVWDAKKFSVAVLGDSFIEGVCVKPEDNILTEIIRAFPNSINLGIIGHGPFTMLGTIKEYLVYKQPEIVVWCYSANDIYPNLAMEKGNTILKQYLQDEFNQDLINRQGEVDTIIEQYIQMGRNKGSNANTEANKKPHQNYFMQLTNSKFIKLYRVRQKVFRSILTKVNSDYELFDKIIKSANKTISSWQGKIIFVYLPGPERFYKNQVDPAKERVLKIIQENGIEAIDIEVEMLKATKPKEFFVNSHSHYNEKGYRFVSQIVLKKITEKK